MKLTPYIGDGNKPEIISNSCKLTVCLKLTPYIGDGNFIRIFFKLFIFSSLKLTPYIGDGNSISLFNISFNIILFETSPVYRGRKLNEVKLECKTYNICLKLAPYIGDGN